jgi:hypothetical protein
VFVNEDECAVAMRISRQEANRAALNAAEVMGDRSSEVCLQGPASNHPQAALSEDRCRERCGRRHIHVVCQVRIEKTSTSESSFKCRY